MADREVQEEIIEYVHLVTRVVISKAQANHLRSIIRKLPRGNLTREGVEPILIKHFDKKTGVLDFMEFTREIIDRFGKG